METQKIKLHIENYIGEVERSIYEPIMDKDVGRTTIDAGKAFFLLLPLLNGERWNNHLNTSAIAVGAVHAALAAHESIDVSNATSKQQQLTVLSGDHFSGIHYRLLASLPEFGFIRSLSETIGQINEMKTTFHNQLPDGPEMLIEAIRIIEAGCVTDFLHTFGFSQYVPLVSAAMSLLWFNEENADSNFSSGKYSCHTMNAADADRAVVLLHAEMQEALDAADYLQPFLKRQLRNLATPLLGKLN
ncbi:MAG TPA: heptaprenyl diphosphate synthase component 1 [Sporosarcina psychrophila]|uniref:Heptaprenyl diphosphate synthase component 1 n=1 Tax=Sporosarcina psychrophila TaxID=1476 RepID=A0A921KFA7_SPOPS|nr:heptaprenyl diphosphate synthase component 1 [Sporosarcina psychrophila]